MFDQIGLFDEDFWLYYEEIDLSWRAYRAGWKSWYHPSAVMYHERGGTEGRFPLGRMYKGERNRVWTNIKNMPLSMLIPSFFYSYKRVFDQRKQKQGYVKSDVSMITIGTTLLKAWAVGIFGSRKMVKKRFAMKGNLDLNQIKKFIQ
jgi:GT2 family glycosyltransferase